ncbi:unnamed protein product [Owenia fusiformis]|uniref:Chloride channel protein n=1 Tax=Owenia fusiformis TaxID=6347 RepID=A0A8S4PKD0_OWEFU|nr:unnamed protein product [Owenia fusiformis]
MEGAGNENLDERSALLTVENSSDYTGGITARYTLNSERRYTPPPPVGSDTQPEEEQHCDTQLLDVKFKSLNYDTCENTLFRDEESAKSYKEVLRLQMSRWLVMFLIGVFTGLIACGIDVSIKYASALKYSTIKHYMDECIKTNCNSIPLLLWIAWNTSGVLIAAILVVYVEPVAMGSGIPQIKCYLNGVKIPRVVRLWTLVCKAVGVIGSVVGGLAVGKEGPMIHSGAVVAAGISQGRSTAFNLDFKIFEYFRTDTEKRDFVSGGAAAGVSAAFGAPIGGVLFSLEEGASFWNQALTWRILFTSMISTFTLNVVLSYAKGEPWNLSNPGLINFGEFSNLSYDGFEIPIFILIGAMGGLFGALFNHINYKLSVFRKQYLSTLKWPNVLEAVIVASMSAVAAFILIFTISNCRSLGEDENENPLQLYCEDGQYNSMATLWFQTPEESVKSLFHNHPGTYKPVTLLLFFTVYFLLASWTYGLSVPSGLFIPCLLTGAAWGRLVGILLSLIFPDQPWADPGKYALIGAAAQLGGVVRMTISLTAILVEATGDITFGLPIMIVLMVAKWTGDLFNEGLYDIHIRLMSVPILQWEPPPITSNILASDVMSHPVNTLRTIERVGRVVDMLKNEPHDGFPVVEDDSENDGDHFGSFRGLILRSQLIVLLKMKIFCEAESEQTVRNRFSKLKLKHFREAYPRFPSIEHIHISAHERDCLIDLTPYMNPSPYCVKDSASLPRIFRLFRGLGLRHIIVINNHCQVVGIVTRKDLARFRVWHHRGRMGLEELQISQSVRSTR